MIRSHRRTHRWLITLLALLAPLLAGLGLRARRAMPGNVRLPVAGNQETAP